MASHVLLTEALVLLRFRHLGQHLLNQVITNISISKALHFLQSVGLLHA